MARVVSVNVGIPRRVIWNNKEIATGIFKEPISGAVKVRKLGFVGDGQADLTAHGGPKRRFTHIPQNIMHTGRMSLLVRIYHGECSAKT